MQLPAVWHSVLGAWRKRINVLQHPASPEAGFFIIRHTARSMPLGLLRPRRR
jgi:hypothetical protein